MSWKTPKNEQLTSSIRVRVTDAEKSRIDEEAERRNLTKSDFFRSVLRSHFDKTPLPKRRSKEAASQEDLTLELVRVGTNLNQVTKALNILAKKTGNLSKVEDKILQLDSLQKELEEIFRRLL